MSVLIKGGGEAILHQSILDACHQPVGNLLDRTGLASRCKLLDSLLSLEYLKNLSAGSSVLEKRSTGDRTIEPSKSEGSTSGGLILRGSKA